MPFRLRWPTEFGLITQRFLARPAFYGEFKYTGNDGNVYALPGHEGIDIQADIGSRVFACADGVVHRVRLDGNINPRDLPYGNQVRIRHADGFETIYAHLLSVQVQQDQPVRAGDVIGLADDTGNSEGSHLHLTLKKRGAFAAGETVFKNDIVDPMPYLDPFPGVEHRIPERLAPDFPLRGLHGDGAANWLRDNQSRGWAVETVYSESDLDHPKPQDFRAHEAAGVRVIVRWNFSFASSDGGHGTYPARAHYDRFVRWCIDSIRDSQGVWGHIIGNEPNRAGERPDYQSPIQPGTPILPSHVSYIVNAVWHHLPQAARVSPPAIDPTNVETMDPREYWRAIVANLDGAEFFALHGYSYGMNQPPDSADKFQHMPWQYHSFRMWQPLVQVLVENARFGRAPLVITETNHLQREDGQNGWEPNADGWIARMYDYTRRWNALPGDQYVHGVCLYRLRGDTWQIDDKPALTQALLNSGAQPI